MILRAHLYDIDTASELAAQLRHVANLIEYMTARELEKPITLRAGFGSIGTVEVTDCGPEEETEEEKRERLHADRWETIEEEIPA